MLKSGKLVNSGKVSYEGKNPDRDSNEFNGDKNGS